MYLYKIIKYSESSISVISVQPFAKVGVNIQLNDPFSFRDYRTWMSFPKSELPLLAHSGPSVSSERPPCASSGRD